ncbi:MAG: hypothetical protein Q9173_005179 [Seirophora scorigena]
MHCFVKTVLVIQHLVQRIGIWGNINNWQSFYCNSLNLSGMNSTQIGDLVNDIAIACQLPPMSLGIYADSDGEVFVGDELKIRRLRGNTVTPIRVVGIDEVKGTIRVVEHKNLSTTIDVALKERRSGWELEDEAGEQKSTTEGTGEAASGDTTYTPWQQAEGVKKQVLSTSIRPHQRAFRFGEQGFAMVLPIIRANGIRIRKAPQLQPMSHATVASQYRSLPPGSTRDPAAGAPRPPAHTTPDRDQYHTLMVDVTASRQDGYIRIDRRHTPRGRVHPKSPSASGTLEYLEYLEWNVYVH